MVAGGRMRGGAGRAGARRLAPRGANIVRESRAPAGAPPRPRPSRPPRSRRDPRERGRHMESHPSSWVAGAALALAVSFAVAPAGPVVAGTLVTQWNEGRVGCGR